MPHGTNAEVFNHVEVAACTHGLHDNFGDFPGIVHELVIYHTNARIVDRDGRIGLVRNGLNEEIWLGLDIFRIGNKLGLIIHTKVACMPEAWRRRPLHAPWSRNPTGTLREKLLTNLLIVRVERRVPPFRGNDSRSPMRRARRWVVDSNPHAEIEKALPNGTSQRSMLTKVHCCLHVSLAPLCEKVLIERGYDDHDCFSFHSCSDGVKMKETQSPAQVCDRAAAGWDPVHTGLPPIRGRSESTFHVLHLPQHRTPGPMPRTRAPLNPR